MELDATTQQRRQHPRTLSHTEAVVSTPRGVFSYTVSNLSAGGALLVGGPAQHEGASVVVTLRLPLYPEVRVPAQVMRCTNDGPNVEVAVAFHHTDDRTEDHIQSALLSEIERSQTEGRIADVM